jgi:hypothetical protein
MAALASRYIHAVFCDDVRMEIGDKITFVGIYQGIMNISAQGIPAIIPKLCIAVSAHAPLTDLFQTLRFRVMKDNILLAESEAPSEQLTAPPEDTTAKYRTIGTVFTISPFIVEKECRIRVYADSEQGEMVSLGLKVNVSLASHTD